MKQALLFGGAAAVIAAAAVAYVVIDPASTPGTRAGTVGSGTTVALGSVPPAKPPAPAHAPPRSPAEPPAPRCATGRASRGG
ncbi:peptidoglycan-binding protein, partial [Azospirillum brasilense]|nr:peptidoglycan-binding protein [Azospirillum brasilense]